MSDGDGLLFGPDCPPRAVGDGFDLWARQVIMRSSLAVSDWWIAENQRGDISATRLQIQIAAALRQAAAGDFNREVI